MQSWINFKALTPDFPEITEKNHEKPQDSSSPGRDLNLGPPEYEAGVVTTRQRRSVVLKIMLSRNMFIHLRFQVLKAASMMFRIVFWDVLPCKIIVDRRFRGTCCLHHQG
jgi:hypothetical protein